MDMKSFLLFFIILIVINSSNDFGYEVISNSELKDSSFQFIDSTLHKIWEVENNAPSSTNLLVSDSKIYIITEDGIIYCYDFNGKEIFSTEIIGIINHNAVLYKDLLLASTSSGDLYSINSNNGDVLQVVGIGENITSDLSLIDIEASSYKGKGIVFGTSEGNIFCYDAFSFELLWKQNITNHPIYSTPNITGDKIIFICSTLSLYCVNAKSGVLNWKYEFTDEGIPSFKNCPTSDGKIVYSLSPDGNIFALDLLRGKKLWSIKTSSIIGDLFYNNVNNKLIVINDMGIVTIINPKDGKEITRVDLKKSELYSVCFAELNNNIFIGFSDGSLYRLDANYSAKELISNSDISITSIKMISDNELVIKDINGKITFYQID